MILINNPDCNQDDYNRRLKEINQRSQNYCITKVAFMAAMLGIEYAKDFGEQTGSEVIEASPISFVIRVLDNLD